MKILVVNLCELGDLLFSTPLIETLGRDHETHYLADQSCAAAVAGHPALARCWTLPRRDWSLRIAQPRERSSVLAQALAWAEALREQRFDRVYCLQPQALAASLAALAGGRQIRGFVLKDGAVSPGEGADLLTRHLRSFENRADDGLHSAEGFLSLLPEGQWPRAAKLSFAVPEASQAYAAALAPGPQRRIAFLPGAGGAHKRWGLPAWIGLSRAWHRLFPKDRVLILGGPEDAERGRILAKGSPWVDDLCGKSDFRGSAALLQRCAAAVGGDTGPMHLAAAVGTPCLGLFGPTHPSESGPLLKGSLALKANGGRMDDLEAGPVLRALAALLSGGSALGLAGAQTWTAREAEGGRISAAWKAASGSGWLGERRRADGVIPFKELAEELMERARLGLERLEGPTLAVVHAHVSLSFKIFSEERA